MRDGDLTDRVAAMTDAPELAQLMALAIDRLQRDVLTAEQIESSRMVMGLDRTLIADGTYFVVESDGHIVGCGGWSRRATPYGGDHSAGRDDRLLDPATEAARVRAMYTHPDHVRRGVGSRVLALCEKAAQQAGFTALELTATLAGLPLYRASGFTDIAHFTDHGVPLVLMRKSITREGRI